MYMELDGAAICEGELFGDECCPEGGLGVLVEFIVGEASEDAALAHSTVADGYEFDFGDAVFVWVHGL